MARVNLVITARDETARAFRAINARASRLGRSFVVPGGESLGEKILKGLRPVGARIRSLFSGGISGLPGRVGHAFVAGVRGVPGLLRRTFSGGLRGVAGVVGRGLTTGVRAAGRGIRSVFSTVFSAVRGIASRIGSVITASIRGGFITTMKSVFKALGPLLISILVPAAFVALSMIGAALAGVLVFAFGAAFVGIAGFIASKAPAVKSAWSRMVTDVKAEWASAGQAFEPVIIHGIGLLRQMSSSFVGPFKEAMRGASGPVQDFLDHFAQSLKDFGKRAFAPMMEGFDAFLLALGPEWDQMMQGMGDAFGALGRTVRDHSGEIAMAFTGILSLITTAIDIINFFANAWVISLRVITAGFGYLILYGVRPLLAAILFLATSALDGFTKAFGWIPGLGGKLKKANQGFKDWAAGINSSLTDMGNNAVNWGKRMDEANKKRKLQVDIGQYTKDLEQARADLKATLSAKAQQKLKMEIQEWTAKLATARQQLATTTKAKAKAALKADISDLERKIARARRLLADQSHRKSQSAIRGDISDLQKKIASARAQLNALNGKTVATYIVTTHVSGGGTVAHEGGRYASGGVVGMAMGGLSRASRQAREVMVGEAGPELVRLPPGSHVRSANATRNMQNDRGGAGGGTSVIELRSDGGAAADLVVELLRRAVKRNGGNVQLAVMGRA
jgi:hypothetical protein